MIEISISYKVLTIGPDFNPPKGGIEMVLMTYSKLIPNFLFLSSWKNVSKALIVIHFCKQISKLILTMIKNQKIKIIHLHGSYGGSVYRKFIILIIAKYIFGKKVIYHSHGSKFEDMYYQGSFFYRIITRLLIEKADAVICLSQVWYSFFKSKFSCQKVFILNNIIEKPNLDLNKKESSNVVKYLFLGVLGERKGIYDLINVILKDRDFFNSKIEVHIGGNGETKKIQHLIQVHDLGNILKFHGWVCGINKIQLLNECDIFILPSYNEGLPIAILEAMSYKMPIISTTVGGIPEVVENGVNGFLITPGDLAGLKVSIQFFMDSPSDIKTFGDESSVKSSVFLPKDVMLNLNSIYKSLL
jgi:glycosyltransferase involved in cell wall biosynthesis